LKVNQLFCEANEFEIHNLLKLEVVDCFKTLSLMATIHQSDQTIERHDPLALLLTLPEQAGVFP